MDGDLGVDGAQEADLGGDLGGQVLERDRGVTVVQLDGRLGRGDPRRGPLAAWWPCDALVISAVRRLRPALSSWFGSA
jgi:hypothetical protein